MKTTLMILTLLLSNFAIAGNGSGTLGREQNSSGGSVGTMIDAQDSSVREAVLFNAANADEIVFDYAKKDGDILMIEKIRLRKTDLVNDASAVQALELSKRSNQWAKIK